MRNWLVRELILKVFFRSLLFFLLLDLLSFSVAFAFVDPALLSEQTLARFEKVPEFEFIIQKANELGVKVYLFGGTAAAFAHYVRWDLEREAGDTKYQKERFDYDFTNIYRGNQDLDIVVDGTSQQADQLKAILQKEYPHFVGDREAWEVRLLRESRGDKRALLGDEDFKKQHSDTNSTGMLLLNPDEGGIVYNDLLNWGSHESDFLNDVAAARIKFLYSEEHEETQRFKDGKNPPVLSAIRYLAKLAQYEVSGTEKDLEIVTQIIAGADFTNLSPYGKNKAEEFALKTLLNAPDSEYAWNLLEKTGARTKLIEMDGERFKEVESLSWWMNKEPLRSKPLGKEGKTARQIFGKEEIIVAHETNSFRAYDNITRSSKGGANAFVSRQKVTGEAAVYGDGFYTRMGMEGARGTGLTIRFKLHPDSREGVDFTRHTYGYIVIKNKKALELIQEDLNIDVIDFLKLTIYGELGKNDKGLLLKLKRKLKRLTHTKKGLQDSLEKIEEELYIGQGLPEDKKFKYWEYDDFSELVDGYIAYLDRIKLGIYTEGDYFWGHNFWGKNKQLAVELFNWKMFQGFVVVNLLSANYNWVDEDLLDLLIKSGKQTKVFVSEILPQEKWSHRTDWIDYYLNKNNAELDLLLLLNVISNFHPHRADWITVLLERNNSEIDQAIVEKIFSKKFPVGHLDWIETLLNRNDSRIDSALVEHVFSKKEASEHPEWIDKVFRREHRLEIDLGEYVFSKKYWKNHPSFQLYVESRFKFDESPPSIMKALNALKGPTANWKITQGEEGLEVSPDFSGSVHVDTVGEVMKTKFIRIRKTLSMDLWAHHPQGLELVKKFYRTYSYFEKPDIRKEIFKYIISKEVWLDNEEVFIFLEEEIKRGKTKVLKYMVESVFSRPHWIDHPKGIRLLKLLLQKVSDFSGYYRDTFNATNIDSPELWMVTQDLYEKIERIIFKAPKFIESPMYFEIMSGLIVEGRGKIRKYVIEAIDKSLYYEESKWFELAKLVILHATKNDMLLIEERRMLKHVRFVHEFKEGELQGVEPKFKAVQEHLIKTTQMTSSKTEGMTCKSILVNP